MKRPRHRWYFVKGALSGACPARGQGIAYCKRRKGFDPFCGSGTVPVEAALGGRTSAAIEVNPFLASVARAKIATVGADTFSWAAAKMTRGIKRGRRSRLEGFSTFTKNPDSKKWLFNAGVLRAFEGGYEQAESLRADYLLLVRLCLMALLWMLRMPRRTGSVFGTGRIGNSWDLRLRISIRLSRSALPWWQRISTVAPLKAPPLSLRPTVEYRRAKQLRMIYVSHRHPTSTHSTIATSIVLNLFLGRWVKSNADLQAIRLKTLRSHLQVKWKDPTTTDFGPSTRRLKKN